jgi:hypothetical protein
VVAVACLALAAGVAIQAQSVRPSILFQSVGPAVRLVTGTPGGSQPGLRQGEQATTRPSPSVVTRASFIASVSQPQAASTAVQTAPDSDAPAAPAEPGPDVAPQDVDGGIEKGAGLSAKAKAEAGRSGKDKTDRRSGKDEAGGRSVKAKGDRGRREIANTRHARSKAGRGSDASRRASASRAPSAKATRKTTVAKSTSEAGKKPKKPKKPAKPSKPAKPKQGG